MIEVARRSGAPLHVSHLKSLADERLIEPLLELLESAAASIDLTFDQYPYGAGSTLLAEHPAGVGAGGRRGGDARRARCRLDERARIARDIAARPAGLGEHLRHARPRADRDRERGGPERGRWSGGRSTEIAADRGDDPSTAALDLMRESALDVTMILHYASDDAVRTIASHRLQLVGSDGIFGAPSASPALRHGAALPRAVRAPRGAVAVEEAVARLTARAADRLGLGDRGRIEPGKRADLVLLDPAALRRHGHLRGPVPGARRRRRRLGRGVRAWKGGAPTGARRGGVVR